MHLLSHCRHCTAPLKLIIKKRKKKTRTVQIPGITLLRHTAHPSRPLSALVSFSSSLTPQTDRLIPTSVEAKVKAANLKTPPRPPQHEALHACESNDAAELKSTC